MTATLVLFVALALGLATASDASAQWTRPFDVSAAGESGERPQVVLDAAGVATVAWRGGPQGVVQARRIGADGALGPIMEVSAGQAGSDPQLAVDPAGNVTVVWTGSDVGNPLLRSRRITAAGAMEAIQTLSAAGPTAREPRVAVAPDGVATVVWVNDDGPDDIIQARRLDAGGAPGPVASLSAPTAFAGGPDVAVDPSGHAYVVWERHDGATIVIQGRRIGAGGALGPVADLSAAGTGAFDPRVAVDGSGIPTAVWHSAGTIKARQGAPGGALGPIADLSPSGSDAPRIAADPAGGAAVVWAHFDGARSLVQLRRIAGDGALGPIADVWTDGNADQPRVAVDGTGGATVVALWEPDAGGYAIRSRTVAPSGALGEPVDLTPVEQELVTPELAGNAGGGAVAMWSRYDDPDYVIAGALFTLPTAPPTAPPSPLPAPLVAPTSQTPPAAAPDCGPVAIGTLRRHSGRTRARRKRAKGVGARLTLSRPGRVQLLAATLAYRHDGRTRRARLAGRRLLASRTRPTLRLPLPARLARRLEVGRRVTLTLRLRARATGAGCDFGRPTTRRLRAKVRR